jgi:GntR family histidine utilization transcriptional repressor
MHKYQKIRLELMKRINSQTWPVGAPIPQEDVLADEFGVARGTIRQALSSLVEAGFLDKKRRSGTRVAYPRTDTSTFRIGLVRDEIEATGGVYDYQLLEDHLNGDTRQLVCLHLKDQRSFQLEQRAINMASIPDAREQRFDATSPGEWLLATYPYTRLDTQICAATPQPTECEPLQLAQNEPIFVIERQTYLDGDWLTRVRLIHPASTYSISVSKVF